MEYEHKGRPRKPFIYRDDDLTHDPISVFPTPVTTLRLETRGNDSTTGDFQNNYEGNVEHGNTTTATVKVYKSKRELAVTNTVKQRGPARERPEKKEKESLSPTVDYKDGMGNT